MRETTKLFILCLALLLVALSVPNLIGCAGWKQGVLLGLDGAGRTAELAPQLMDTKCDNLMETCRKENRTTPVDCPELEKCHADEHLVAKTSLSIQVLILGGIKAVEVSDEPGAKKILAKVIEMAGPLQRVLLAWGVKL